MVKLLGRIALWQRAEPPRGRIHMGKIAGFKTLAHEKALPFFEDIYPGLRVTEVVVMSGRNSTKRLVSVAYVVFYRIHNQLEPVLDFEFAVD